MRCHYPLVLNVGSEVVEPQVKHRVAGKVPEVDAGALPGKHTGGELIRAKEGELSNVDEARVAQVGFGVVAIIQARFEEMAAATGETFAGFNIPIS